MWTQDSLQLLFQHLSWSRGSDSGLDRSFLGSPIHQNRRVDRRVKRTLEKVTVRPWDIADGVVKVDDDVDDESKCLT